MKLASTIRIGFSRIGLGLSLLLVGWAGAFQTEVLAQSQAVAHSSTVTQPAEFDLDAFVASLKPPSVEEIIASLGPIPTLEECLAALPDDPSDPWSRVLIDEDKTRVEELEEQIAELREQGKYAEAVLLAEEVAEIRQRVQGADHWQAVDGRRLVETLEFVATLPAAAQAELAEADRADDQYKQLHDAAKHDQALEVICRQLQIRERVLGEQHPETVGSRYHLAVLLGDKAHYAASLALYYEAFGEWRVVLGDEHPDVSACLSQLAVVLWCQGDFASSAVLQRRSLAIDRKVLGDQHADWAIGLNNLGMLCLATGDLRGAERLLTRTLELRRELFPDGDEDLASSLHNLAGFYKDSGKYTRAEQLFREALAMRQELHGPQHPEVAVSLGTLGELLRKKGDYEEAERLQRKALAIRREVFGPEHPEVGKSLHNLANVLQEMGNYFEAEQLYREARPIHRKWLGNEHPALGRSLSAFAMLMERVGNYASAEPMYREALAISRKAYGNEHGDVAAIMDNLAGLLRSKGDYGQAEQLYRDALAMRRQIFGDTHPEVAASLNNLAGVLHDQGEPALAEEYYREALEICREVHGNAHYRVARTLNNLGSVLSDLGDYAAAESLYCDALELKRRLLGDLHPDVANSLNNLAMLRRDRGEYAEAESLSREALLMWRKLLGSEHPDVARGLSNLASVLEADGRYAEAERLAREALAICEMQRTRVVGAERERAAYAGVLGLAKLSSRLARLLLYLGRPDEAFAVLERGRGRAILDLLARADRDLVSDIRAKGDAETASELDRLLRQEQVAQLAVTAAESALAATQKRKDLSEVDHQALVAAKIDGVKQARHRLADAQALTLARLGKVWPDAQPMTTQQIRAALESDELMLCYSWSSDAVMLFVVPPEGGELTGRFLAQGKDAVHALTQQASELQRAITRGPRAPLDLSQLASLQRDLGARLLPQDITSRVCRARRVIMLPAGPLTGLPLDALTVEVGMDDPAHLLDAGPEIVYAESATVYVNRRLEASKRPTVVDARSGRSPALASAVILGNPTFDRAHRQPQYPEHGVLIARVFDDSNAAQAGLVRGDTLLSYDGQEVPDPDVLVARLRNARQEVDAGQRDPAEGVVVRYWRDGNIREATVAPRALGVNLARGSPKDNLQLLAMRSRGESEAVAEVCATDQYRLFGKTLAQLPGTEQEAKAVAALFRGIKRHGGEGAPREVSLLLGADATVERLECAVEGRRIVHIATHGLTGSRERPYQASLALAQPETPTPEDIGFLTLDHLIKHWRGKLKHCDLVVLSACDTQRGVKLGDSMMALPCGFMYAGAPSVVASLWKVDDTAAALLMIRFYQNMLGHFDQPRGLSGRTFSPGKCVPKAEALREAKFWLRGLSAEQVRTLCDRHDLPRPSTLFRGEAGPMDAAETTEHVFEHPYYWSAFILIGDPQ